MRNKGESAALLIWRKKEEHILYEESLHLRFLRLVGEISCGSWSDYLVAMTVTEVLVELRTERERIEKKPDLEKMIQPDGKISITFIWERLFGRREKRREGYGIMSLALDGELLYLENRTRK